MSDLSVPAAPMHSTKRYVAGFLLSADDAEVVLVRKNRPAWQAGCLNGVGGKVEPGESDGAAMSREFFEETGLRVPEGAWELLVTISWPDDAVRIGDPTSASVAFYRHRWSAPETLSSLVRSCTDEEIEVWSVADALASGRVIPNLSWLLPLATYRADRYAPFVVEATTAELAP